MKPAFTLLVSTQIRDRLNQERGQVREGGNVIQTFLGSLQLSQFASPPPLPNRNNVNMMIWIHGHALFPVWSNKMLLCVPINVSKIRFHWSQGTSYPTFLLHLWKLQRLPSLPYAAKGRSLPHSSPVFGRLRIWSPAAVIRAPRFQAVATCVLLLSFPSSYHCPNTHDKTYIQKFSMKFRVYCFWSVGSCWYCRSGLSD